jgi:hypothetical protein
MPPATTIAASRRSGVTAVTPNSAEHASALRGSTPENRPAYEGPCEKRLHTARMGTGNAHAYRALADAVVSPA